MKLQRLSFTFITGIFFLIALIQAGLLLGHGQVVQIAGSQNSATIVLVGEASNKLFGISKVEQVPESPTRYKVANHSRTLRAFVIKQADDRTALFLEQAKPRESYRVESNFLVSQPNETLRFVDEHTLSFRAIFPDGTRGMLAIDLETLENAFLVEKTPTAVSRSGSRSDAELFDL